MDNDKITVRALLEELKESIETVYDPEGRCIREELKLEELARFKSAAGAVTSILAVCQSCALADELEKRGKIDTGAANGIKSSIENPNKNGFDIKYKGDSVGILAELKSTIPCGKDSRYGAKQRESISSDVENLSGRSNKHKKCGIELSDYPQKYMVLFDVEGQRGAMKALDKDMCKGGIEAIYIPTDLKVLSYADEGWVEEAGSPRGKNK